MRLYDPKPRLSSDFGSETSSLTPYMKPIKKYHKVASNLNLVQRRLQDSICSMKVNLTCITQAYGDLSITVNLPTTGMLPSNMRQLK